MNQEEAITSIALLTEAANKTPEESDYLFSAAFRMHCIEFEGMSEEEFNSMVVEETQKQQYLNNLN